MKLTEFKDEEALEVLADLIEPATAILGDTEVIDLIKKNALVVRIAATAIRNHKSDVIKMLSALHRCKPEDYHFNIVSLTMDLLEVLNDRELMDFFRSQGQMTESTSFGSATVNTEGKE